MFVSKLVRTAQYHPRERKMGSIISEKKRAWEEVVAEKCRIRDELVRQYQPKADESSPSEKVEFVSVEQIVACLSRGEISSEELVTAHVKRVCAVHKETNALTEVCFNDAIASAKALDAQLKTEGKPVGPLHGVPMTLKDQFNIKGYDSTLGYVSRAQKPAEDDAVLVKMLRSLGAVIMAKTNLPQSIMWCETDNPIFGLTTNPLNPAYTPGGSTGGEAVLIARGASVLGFGTDLGGSIRIPSHMMGIYGLKPSYSRLPYHGTPVSTDGQEHVPSAVGPMAATLSTIHLVTKSLTGLQPWLRDARCAPIPWREEAYTEPQSRPLVFAVLQDDGVARPHPPITRVLNQAVEAIRAAGHEVIEWNPDLHAECVEVMDEFYTADGGEDIRSAVVAGGEPFIPHVEKLVNRGQPISVYEYWQLNRRKFALQQAYLEKWNSIRTADGRAVDAIIMPPMPHTSVPHGGCRWVGYTKVWNFLDYSALVIPGGKVSQEDLSVPWEHEARGEVDEWSLKLWAAEKTEMARLELPVGVQIVGRRLEEEKVLGIGKVVDDLLRTTK